MEHVWVRLLCTLCIYLPFSWALHKAIEANGTCKWNVTHRRSFSYLWDHHQPTTLFKFLSVNETKSKITKDPKRYFYMDDEYYFHLLKTLNITDNHFRDNRKRKYETVLRIEDTNHPRKIAVFTNVTLNNMGLILNPKTCEYVENSGCILHHEHALQLSGPQVVKDKVISLTTSSHSKSASPMEFLVSLADIPAEILEDSFLHISSKTNFLTSWLKFLNFPLNRVIESKHLHAKALFIPEMTKCGNAFFPSQLHWMYRILDHYEHHPHHTQNHFKHNYTSLASKNIFFKPRNKTMDTTSKMLSNATTSNVPVKAAPAPTSSTSWLERTWKYFSLTTSSSSSHKRRLEEVNEDEYENSNEPMLSSNRLEGEYYDDFNYGVDSVDDSSEQDTDETDASSVLSSPESEPTFVDHIMRRLRALLKGPSTQQQKAEASVPPLLRKFPFPQRNNSTLHSRFNISSSQRLHHTEKAQRNRSPQFAAALNSTNSKAYMKATKSVQVLQDLIRPYLSSQKARNLAYIPSANQSLLLHSITILNATHHRNNLTQNNSSHVNTLPILLCVFPTKGHQWPDGIENVRMIIAFAKKFHYNLIIHTDRTPLSLSQEIILFQHASIVIAPHGVGLFFTAFVPTHACIIEMMPSLQQPPCYARIAYQRGLHYMMFMMNGGAPDRTINAVRQEKMEKGLNICRDLLLVDLSSIKMS
jgi:hypothetical protein